MANVSEEKDVYISAAGEHDDSALLGLQLAEKRKREREEKEHEESILKTTTEEYIQNTSSSDDYVSPFSDDFAKNIPTEEEEPALTEEEEEAETMVDNRLRFYLMVLGVAYAIFLCVGWYMTSYTGDMPNLITFEDRDRHAYLERVDEYIISLQNLRAEAVVYLEQYDTKTAGIEETSSRMHKISEKLQKQKEEISDIVPPPQLDGFHIRLGDLYSSLIAYTNAVETYAKMPNKSTGSKLDDANERFDKISQSFLNEYDNLFKQ